MTPGLRAGSAGRLQSNSLMGGEDAAQLVIKQGVGVRELQGLSFWHDFYLLEGLISFESMVSKVIHVKKNCLVLENPIISITREPV